MPRNFKIAPQTMKPREAPQGKTLLTTPEIVLPEPSGEDRPPTPHLSNTQLSMFHRCPQQYKFRYIDGLKERPSVSLSIGKGGHEALEWNTKTKIRTGKDADENQLIQKASDLMDHHLREVPPSEVEKDVEPGGFKDKMLAATRVYRRKHAPAIRPIGAEIEFNLDVNKYLPRGYEVIEPIRIVNGKIDVMEDDYETLMSYEDAIRISVVDYKYVGKRMKSQAEVNLMPQLSIYNTVVYDLTQKLPTKAGLRVMHPGTTKEPPDSKPIFRSPEQMTPEALKNRMGRIALQFAKLEDAIRYEVFYPTDNPINCGWCGFRTKCQDSLVNDIEAAIIQKNHPNPSD